jgi:hypothetical protein
VVDGPDESAGDESFHTLVCTDTAPGVNWQCQVLIQTWRAVGQPGAFVRLVAAPDGGPVPTHVHGRVVTTRASNTHPDSGDHYPPYNRMLSMQEWLSTERPEGLVLFVDPDMVFRSRLTTRARKGTAAVQPWFDFDAAGPSAAALARATGIDRKDLPAVTWPAVIHTTDLERLLPRWIELTAAVRDETGLWVSDMFGFVGALAEVGPALTPEVITAWMNWPE